jgi:hypothetical protein
MLLGTDWKSKTGHEAEDDDGDDEVVFSWLSIGISM